MKRTITLVGMAFAVGLAVVVGNRMSSDAMGVVVGVACGVLASVPTSLLVIWAMGRRGQGMVVESQARNGVGTPYPPVVVVNPGPGYGMSGYGAAPPPLGWDRGLLAGGPRQFKVVGEEETVLDARQPMFPGLADDWDEAK
jgi:hypothetical protein